MLKGNSQQAFFRTELPFCNKVLIKVGSSNVIDGDGKISIGLCAHLVDQICDLVKRGKQVIFVSSGSIALGRSILKQQRNERTPSDRECAAAGQMKMMGMYDYLFQVKGVPASQILLSNDDFLIPERQKNLHSTLENLLAAGVVPVLNENDVTTFVQGTAMLWDNDSLASLVSILLDVDLTILLTDVDGLFTHHPSNPQAQMIYTYSPSMNVQLIGKSSVGRGGMESKINAALLVVNSSNPSNKAVVIANGRKNGTISSIVNGELIGTLFLRPHHEAIQSVNCQSQPKETSAKEMALEAKEASRILQALPANDRADIMMEVAHQLLQHKEDILRVNAEDIKEYQSQPDFNPQIRARLELSSSKLDTVVAGIKSLANDVRKNDPVGRILKATELADGLILQQTTTPIGVILVIFESRPDSLPQICSLTFLSGNGLLLKGGKEARRSNALLHQIIVDTIHFKSNGKVPKSVIGLVETRESIKELLEFDEYINLVIPRGSSQLVRSIQQNTKIPVLGHAEGICHVYVHEDGDLEKSLKIVIDSKTDYPAACNAAETLLLNRKLIQDGIAAILLKELRESKVQLFGGPKASAALGLPLAPQLKVEYGDLKMNVEIVEDVEEAVQYISKYGSSHTDAIVTENLGVAEYFMKMVDSACVFHNCSTRFADGYRFGLGAEVGISTGRIHARGPVGIEGLLTMKWKLYSSKGHIVSEFTKGDKKFTHQPIPLSKL